MRYVSYLRVSTAKQGSSGLGVEAQREAVRRFIEGQAGRPDGPTTAGVVWPPLAQLFIEKSDTCGLIEEFREIESGKSHTNRPELAKAMRLAKACGATLIVAKLDRLSRDPDFLGALMKSGVEFCAVDNPHANKLTVRILAAVAEDERERTSARTKAALASVRARLVAGEPYVSRASGRLVERLGNPNGAACLRRSGNRGAGAEAVKRQAAEWAAEMRESIRDIGEGLPLAEVAAVLEAKGYGTRRGGRWTPRTVARIMTS